MTFRVRKKNALTLVAVLFIFSMFFQVAGTEGGDLRVSTISTAGAPLLHDLSLFRHDVDRYCSALTVSHEGAVLFGGNIDLGSEIRGNILGVRMHFFRMINLLFAAFFTVAAFDDFTHFLSLLGKITGVWGNGIDYSILIIIVIAALVFLADKLGHLLKRPKESAENEQDESD